ncbi:MAG: class C beta-lactamase-related serine hydrolase [Candidatus Thorarchaeota archaeon]|nr:class C beta-lactamase-related serine hydrolase [Candidatus Thorarchaeota archaeon]
MNSKGVALTILLLVLQLSVNGVPMVTAEADTYFPTNMWTSTSPEEQGMSSAVLNDMMQFIDDSNAAIKGLVITRNGYIVKEGYWGYNTENTTRHIFSCTKSFTGALVGIALKEGFLDNVSQKVLDFFSELTIGNPDARKEEMTIEHLLTMTTGLDWNEWNISYTQPDNMYNQMFGFGVNSVEFFLSLPMVFEPGEHWVYTTGASHVLSAIIQAATGMSTYDFAKQYLFDPLNMTIGGWGTDNQGIHIGGTLLFVTPRSMAKLGLLYINNGTWNGNEIMTEEYVAQSFAPHANATLLSTNYGYQWWVNPREGLCSAIGSEGQYIHVIRKYNVVVAITASADEPGEDVSDDILRYVHDSVLTESHNGVNLLLILGIAGVALVVVAVVMRFQLKKQR